MAGDTDGEITVQMLWDIEQIKQLKARYFRFLDAKDWEAFADLFTDDCVHFLPEESPVPSVDNATYLATLPGQLQHGVTTHHGHMPEITLLSATEASGIWSMFDYVQVETDAGMRIDIQGYGHYHETYRKGDDGKWRIASKRNTRQRLDRVSPPPSA